eukprot:2248592-Rhodomonas_salina.3
MTASIEGEEEAKGKSEIWRSSVQVLRMKREPQSSNSSSVIFRSAFSNFGAVAISTCSKTFIKDSYLGLRGLGKPCNSKSSISLLYSSNAAATDFRICAIMAFASRGGGRWVWRRGSRWVRAGRAVPVVELELEPRSRVRAGMSVSLTQSGG